LVLLKKLLDLYSLAVVPKCNVIILFCMLIVDKKECDYKGFLLPGKGETRGQLAKSQGAPKTDIPLKMEVRGAGELRKR
jgi:hypothetical protein